MGRQLCRFNGVGFRRKASGIDTEVGKKEGRIGLVVVCVQPRRDFEPRSATDGWFGIQLGELRRPTVRCTVGGILEW